MSSSSGNLPSSTTSPHHNNENTSSSSNAATASASSHHIPNFRSQYYFQLGLKSIAVPSTSDMRKKSSSMRSESSLDSLEGLMELEGYNTQHQDGDDVGINQQKENTTMTNAVGKGSLSQDGAISGTSTSSSALKASSSAQQWPHLLLFTPISHLHSLLSHQSIPSSPVPPIPLNYVGRILMRLTASSAGWGSEYSGPGQFIMWLKVMGSGDWDKWLLRGMTESGGGSFGGLGESHQALAHLDQTSDPPGESDESKETRESSAPSTPFPAPTHLASPRLTPQQIEQIENLTEQYIDDSSLIETWRHFRMEEYREKMRRRAKRKKKLQETTASGAQQLPIQPKSPPPSSSKKHHSHSIILKVWTQQIESWELSLEAVEYQGWTARGRYLLEAFDSIERIKRLPGFKKEPRPVNTWHNMWQLMLDTLRRTELKHDFLMFQCFSGMMLKTVESNYFMLGHWEDRLAKMVQQMCILCCTAMESVFNHIKHVSSSAISYRSSECWRLLPSAWQSAASNENQGAEQPLNPEQAIVAHVHPVILSEWIKWFSSMFSSVISEEGTLRMWSVIFCRNPVDMMPCMAVGIMTLMRPVILRATSLEALKSVFESFPLKERKVDQVIQQSNAYYKQRFSLHEVFLSSKCLSVPLEQPPVSTSKSKSKSPVARIRRSSIFSRSPPATSG